MILKNEQGFIGECLNSVKDIADEIIIVDTGSTDETLETINNLELRNIKIFNYKWDDNFSKARNFSISKATKDWILVMDADETIAKKDLIKIKGLANNKTKGRENILGYKFIQRTYSNIPINLKKWVCLKDDNYKESKGYLGYMYRGITRLFRNNKGIRFEYPIHETVIHSIKRLKGKIENSDIAIHHYGFLRDKKILKANNELYLELIRKKIKKYNKERFRTELKVQKEIVDKLFKTTY